MKRLICLVVVIFGGSSAATIHAQMPTTGTLITVENAAQVTQVGVLEGHEGSVNSITFSPDGRLASGGEDSIVRLWDVQATKAIFQLEGHAGKIITVAFNLDGTFLASTGLDFKVLIWDTANGTRTEQSMELAQDSADMLDAAAQTDIGFRALAWVDGIPMAAGDGGTASFDERLSWQLRDPTFYSFDVSPNGLLFASGSTEGIQIISVESPSGTETPVYNEHSDAVLAVTFNSMSDFLASASADGTIQLWSVPDHENVAAVAMLEGHTDDVTGVAFSPDGSLLVSSSLDGTLRLWDVAAQVELAMLTPEGGAGINSVAFSPDGSLIASAGADGLIRLWGIEGSSEPSDTSGTSVIPQSGTWTSEESPNVSFIVGNDNKVHDLQMELDFLNSTCNIEADELEIGPDGTFVFASAKNLGVIDQETWDGLEGFGYHLQILEDGTTLASMIYVEGTFESATLAVGSAFVGQCGEWIALSPETYTWSATVSQ